MGLNLFAILVFIVAFIYLACFVRVLLYEYQINQAHKRLENEVEVAKSHGDTLQFVEGNVALVKEKWERRLDELKRKRQFILDKLPFLRN
jgi:hypothetical protein